MKLENKPASRKTRTHEGGEAYTLDIKQRLVNGVLTSFYNEAKFYGNNTSVIMSDAKSMAKNDPKFLAQLAIFARNEMYLRTFPTVLLGVLALEDSGRDYVRDAIRKTILRPDQMIELAVFLNGQSPDLAKRIKQVTKGFADKFAELDEYRLAKYKKETGKIKLRDILKISHPVPKDEAQATLFKKLLEGTLEPPVTWEVEVSAKGNKAEVWDNLFNTKKLPYMAALRNLRNILQSGAKCLSGVLDMISDEKAVRKSMQLPFRYYSAYRMLESEVGSREILSSLDKALRASIGNLPRLNGVTFTSADNSGSMGAHISEKSIVAMWDIANLFQSICNVMSKDNTGSVFGESFKVVNVSTEDNIINSANRYKNTNVGHSTNGHLVVKYLYDKKVKVDRIVIFSDMQFWENHYLYGQEFHNYVDKYRKEVNPNVWLHLVDLAGYGTTPAIGKNVNIISGWSDNIFKFIELAEAGEGNLINTIQQVDVNKATR